MRALDADFLEELWKEAAVPWELFKKDGQKMEGWNGQIGRDAFMAGLISAAIIIANKERARREDSTEARAPAEKLEACRLVLRLDCQDGRIERMVPMRFFMGLDEERQKEFLLKEVNHVLSKGAAEGWL